MLHIAICDDEKKFVCDLQDLLNRYMLETGEEIKITVYYDGLELIEKYDTTIDLIFLDIKMNHVNGLKAAMNVRKKDNQVGIIFLTTFPQYGLEGYKYQAVNYIIKPIKYTRLKLELDQWRKRYCAEESPFITVANDSGKYKVYLKNLRYIETFNRNLLLHVQNEKIICYKNMKQMECALSEKIFFRCHTSYIINLAYVKNVKVKELQVELITGEVIPISQPKRKIFMERITKYLGEHL